MGGLLVSGAVDAQDDQDFVPWRNVYENCKEIPQKLKMQLTFFIPQIYKHHGQTERFDACEEYSLDKNGLKNFFKCTEQECEVAFQFFDLDGSGTIDGYEFACALTLLCDGKPQEKAELLFSFYDFDGNQYLSHEEIVILMTNCLTALNCMEGNKEAVRPDQVEKKARDMLLGADQNADQKLSKSEFMSFATKNKECLALLKQFNLIKEGDLRKGYGPESSSKYPQRKSTVGEHRMTATYGEGFDIQEEEIEGVPDCDSDLDEETNPKRFSRSAKSELIKLGVEEGLNKRAAQIEATDLDDLFTVEEQKGDQFMAVKPWEGVIKHSKPTFYRPSGNQGQAPDAGLELEHIYGYRCFDSRNNIAYDIKGELIFPAAGVGVCHNQRTNKQRHFIHHTDDITCLASHPDRNIIATGEVGRRPIIHIWNATSVELIVSIQGDLERGIKHLAFSSDGRYLAAIAADDRHTGAIYDWRALYDAQNARERNNAKIAHGTTTRANVMAIGFTLDPDKPELVLACVKEINFINFLETGSMKCRRGIGWSRKSPHQTLLSLAFLQNDTISGGYNGGLVIWNKRKIVQTFRAHQAAVTALFTRDKGVGFISGSNDNTVIVWDSDYTNLHKFDTSVKGINSLNPKVRAVCESPLGIIAVGLRGGELVEFTEGKPHLITRSHFEGELWGISPHPTKDEFVTIGQDNVFAVWSLTKRKQKIFARLDNPADVIQYSPVNGKYIALGYHNGQVTVLSGTNYSTVAIRKDRKQPISDVKFSPDQTILAVAGHDSLILTYRVDLKFKPHRRLKGHHSAVLHMDFSENSRVLKTMSSSYQILFFDVDSGKQDPSGASNTKDEAWATYTCTLGWQSQGIWPPCSDGSDINAVDRTSDNEVLATVDDFSQVKLFRYPCPVEKANYVKYKGHSSHITNARFTQNKKYLLTTGGHDKCIFQWRYVEEEEKEPGDTGESKLTVEKELEEDEQEAAKLTEDLFQIEEQKGDQFMAVRPYKGEVEKSRPKGFKIPASAHHAPSQDLQIEYVHGYRSFDTRNSLKYTASGQIVYTTAALGVVMDTQTRDQEYFMQHTDDVVALALHPNGIIVATGQMAHATGRRHASVDLYIWDSGNSATPLAHFTGIHKRAIRVLAFSPSGSRLLAVGDDDNHTMTVHEWAKGILSCTVKLDRARVLYALFTSQNEVVTCGVKHVKFWVLKGQNPKCNRALFGKQYGPEGREIHVCLARYQQKVVSGTHKGTLVLFKENKISKVLQKAHQAQISSLLSFEKDQGWFLASGGHDGVIKVWDYEFTKPVIEVDLKVFLQFDPAIRAFDMNSHETKIVVGTRGAQIVEIPLAKGGLANGITAYPSSIQTLMQGHSFGEVWGLAQSPKDDLFATCGDDRTLRIWQKRQLVAHSNLIGQESRAVDWASDGSFIVVGCNKGKVYSFQLTEGKNKELKRLNSYSSSFTRDNQWIQDIKISPNSKLIALGAHGCASSVQLISVDKAGQILKKMVSLDLQQTAMRVGLTSALTHLDWSSSSDKLVVNSQAYELKFVDTKQLQNIAASDTPKISWHTWTCVLGFPVQGIFPPYADGSDVNSACRSNNKHLLATGDDFGKIKIFNYPSVLEHSPYKEYAAHSSHVTNVRFSANDRYLASVGGHDKTLILWRAEDPDQREEDLSHVPAEEVEDSYETEEEDSTKEESKKEETEEEKIKEHKKQKKEEPDVMAMFEIEDAGPGDQFMAVKPWKGAIKAPTGFVRAPYDQSKPPDIDLELEYVYGYRARDCKNNLRYAGQSIIYHAAALGVVLQRDENTQKFFNKHRDDIIAFDFHKDTNLIATGEVGAKPSIYVWNKTGTQVRHFKGTIQKGIQALAFSESGRYLAAVGKDMNHTLAIMDLETGATVSSQKGDSARILGLCWINDIQLVTVGIRHYKFWTRKGRMMKEKRGLFGKRENRLGCVAANSEGVVFTGTVSGALHAWKFNQVVGSVRYHKRAIDGLYVDHQYLMTGSRDGVLVIQKPTQKMELLFTIDLTSETREHGLGCVHAGVRSIDRSQSGNELLLGTFGSEIIEARVDFSGGKVSSFELLHRGHYAPCFKDNNEVWGLSLRSHPDEFLTVSDDATLRLWSISERRQIFQLDLTKDEKGEKIPHDSKTRQIANSVKARCIAVNVSSSMDVQEFKAIGFRDGSVRLYNSKWGIIDVKHKRKQQISDLKFSPDGKMLAVGSHDNFIDIYEVGDSWKLRSVLRAHSSYITHIDWSLDSKYLRSNCGAYELLFWDANTGKQMAHGASELKDTKWATQNCIFGWHVQGIWPPYSDGTDINAVDRSNQFHKNNCELLATVDDFGKLRILRYPSIEEKSKGVEGKGHSSHVTNVKFSLDDHYVLTTGGNDQCVFQWKLTE